jgi:hypothetical protein
VIVVATSNAATIQAVTTDNLVANGDAEGNAAACASDCTGDKKTVDPWVRNGYGVTFNGQTGCDTTNKGSTEVRYDSPGGFPDYGDPGPADRGTFFWAGGPNCSKNQSFLIQCIDVSAHTPTVNHPVTFDLDGFLGGFKNQKDNARVGLFFTTGANCTGSDLGGTSFYGAAAGIGPVTNNDRAGITGLLERHASGDVPHGTNGILVAVVFKRFNASYNDGYLDNLTLTETIHTVTS